MDWCCSSNVRQTCFRKIVYDQILHTLQVGWLGPTFLGPFLKYHYTLSEPPMNYYYSYSAIDFVVSLGHIIIFEALNYVKFLMFWTH